MRWRSCAPASRSRSAARTIICFPTWLQAINTLPVIPTSLTVCTDDVFPDYLVEHGGINDVLRRLIRYGLDPLQAIRCATINNAIRLRRDDLGLVAAGRRADLVALSDLKEVKVEAVYSGGRHVAQGGTHDRAAGRHCAAAREYDEGRSRSRPTISAFGCRAWSTAGRSCRPSRARASIPGAKPRSRCATALPSSRPNLSLMAIVHRHGRNDPKPALAIIEGWDRWGGAFATSYSHDSHNLILYGHDAAELALAANTVIGMKGGIVVVRDGKVAAQARLSGRGHAFARSAGRGRRAAHKRIVEAAGEICAWQPPYRTFKALSGQSLACNPGPHLTDLGLTDGTTKEIRPGLDPRAVSAWKTSKIARESAGSAVALRISFLAMSARFWGRAEAIPRAWPPIKRSRAGALALPV